ncbi:MAG TPA: Smr/MutS family protein [Flavobacterium sp.]|jgi:dsDNA-specific endonuclease/ATPase MutS2
MFKKGDRVTVLDDDYSGVVISVNAHEVTIETTDGFELSYRPNELVKIEDTGILRSSAGSFDPDAVKKQKEIPKPRSFVKEKKVKGEIPPPEFDLHIEKLVKNWRGLSNYEILTIQTETAKRHIEFAVRNRIPKIIFIHGVGEGILKAELDFMLGRYDNITFRDANYQKYGLGATEITLRQNTV